MKPPRGRRSGLGTSALANPSTARSSACPHAASRDRRQRSGRPGWKPQARQTRRVGTVFLSVRSLTALCALGVTGSANKTGDPSWLEPSRKASQAFAATCHPAQDPRLLDCVGFYGLRQGRPRLSTSGSSASLGLARWSDESPTPSGFIGPAGPAS